MKVELLIVGWLTSAAGIWRAGDDLERQLRFPVPAYVIETGDERILVDTGLHPAAVEDPARHYGAPDALGLFQLELDESIGEQVELTTITRVVLTHLHFDHAGGSVSNPRSGTLKIPASAGILSFRAAVRGTERGSQSPNPGSRWDPRPRLGRDFESRLAAGPELQVHHLDVGGRLLRESSRD